MVTNIYISKLYALDYADIKYFLKNHLSSRTVHMPIWKLNKSIFSEVIYDICFPNDFKAGTPYKNTFSEGFFYSRILNSIVDLVIWQKVQVDIPFFQVFILCDMGCYLYFERW